MQSELANILINRNILLVGMEIEATYESITLDGTSKVAAFGGFMIQKIIRNEETTEFQTVSIHDGHKRIIHVANSQNIDLYVNEPVFINADKTVWKQHDDQVYYIPIHNK